MRGVVALTLGTIGALATDSMGQTGTDYARCHVYYGTAGEYGACNSYKTKPSDIDGSCGALSDPCISTTSDISNCGLCYKVDMTYATGTVKTVYIKAVDLNGSDTKFEMSQNAWQTLCPYACNGYDSCVTDASVCPYGPLPANPDYTKYDAPATCAISKAQVKWTVVDCGNSPAPGPNPSPNTIAVADSCSNVLFSSTGAVALCKQDCYSYATGQCASEATDGCSLAKCVKKYVPQCNMVMC